MKAVTRYANEMGLPGLISVGLAAFALAVALLVLYRVSGDPLGQAPLTETKEIVPATGLEGFPVEEFCQDSLTTAGKWLVSPVDTPYSAAYSLERRKDGVHETVDVFVYADALKDPRAVHYRADGVSEDAFMTRKALECVERKAKLSS